MSDGGLKVEQPMESVEALSREAEGLKVKLEEERQKLNDVPREYTRNIGGDRYVIYGCWVPP